MLEESELYRKRKSRARYARRLCVLRWAVILRGIFSVGLRSKSDIWTDLKLMKKFMLQSCDTIFSSPGILSFSSLGLQLIGDGPPTLSRVLFFIQNLLFSLKHNHMFTTSTTVFTAMPR